MSFTKKYFPNLDALRFLAALGVIFSHLVHWLSWPDTQISKWTQILMTLDGTAGFAGVSFFFTLSGFLITYLMYEEKLATSTFNVKNFYIRRFLRIWPLYYVSLLLSFVVYPHLVSIANFHETSDWRMYALFLGNFDLIQNPLNKGGLLGVQWSIAVEEQFYLFWPIVFVIAGNKKLFPWICASLVLISAWFRMKGMSDFHTIPCLADLSLGGLLAYCAIFYSASVDRFFQKFSKGSTLIVYGFAAALLIGSFQISRLFPEFGLINRSLYSLFFGFVIMEQNYSPNSFFKFGSISWFSRWGKISYGIYLLHMLPILLFRYLNTLIPLPIVISVILSIALAILLSAISYRFLEGPFLKLKEKL